MTGFMVTPTRVGTTSAGLAGLFYSLSLRNYGASVVLPVSRTWRIVDTGCNHLISEVQALSFAIYTVPFAKSLQPDFANLSGKMVIWFRTGPVGNVPYFVKL